MSLTPIPAAASLPPVTQAPSKPKKRNNGKHAIDIENQEMHRRIRKAANDRVVVLKFNNAKTTQLPQLKPVPTRTLVKEPEVQKSADAQLLRPSNVQRIQPGDTEAASLIQDVSRKYLELHADALGAGTTGKVMKGIDLTSGVTVAVKKCKSEIFSQVFANEIRILKELNRRQVPHSLHLRDAFVRPASTRGGTLEHVIVTDYIPTKNVYELRHLFTWYPQILCLGRQLLEYLAGMSPDIVHGDPSLVNLMYEFNCNHLTVIDNGLSQKISDNGFELIQTSFYRCPEAILSGPIDCSADIWSVGCILFELMTGSPLFNVYDHKQDLTISSAILLQKIAAQLGMPAPRFLQKCSETAKYYRVEGSQVHFHKYLPLKEIAWREAILTAASSRGMLPDQAHEFIHLLEGMLRYENRLSARELLQSPLFYEGISFHLAPTFAVGDFITIYRAWDMDRHLGNPAEVPFPLPFFQLKYSHVSRTCHHMPVRDPLDRYIVYVQRQGISYFGQLWEIQDGQELGFHFLLEQPVIPQVIAGASSRTGAL
ncbi:MAG: serine/threonine-protein kinase [Verrucomicrobia bacterium]|nr:serine/threonine-protein kinase [Verrucomicrobiota bacterium]